MGRKTSKRKVVTPPRKTARTAASSRARKAETPRVIEAAMAALAHDVRTPLTSIVALAELLATSDLPDRERGWARAIKSAADHLTQLTSIVLDGVKADTAGLVTREEPFSPRRLAEAAGASLSARAGTSGLSAEVAIGGELPDNAIGDPVRLRAALENLIDNAVKFTTRGSVKLAVAAKAATRNRVKLSFAVTDSGIGLTRTEAAKLFRPFAQASADVARRYGGTGLGLVMVKRLAKAMGGDLTVTSKPGAGSTFTLSVLVKNAPAAAPERSASRKRKSEPVSLRILCAEDNPFGRVVLSTMLTEFGHRVDFAGTGGAVLKALARGGYDLVLMDVVLPDGDGLATTRRIRALPGSAGRIPVIGISGRSRPQDIARARDAGMTDYLLKPVTAAMLAEALAKLRR